MAKYVVLEHFKDRQTGRIYQPGDSFPGNTKKARIHELLSQESPGRDHQLVGKSVIAIAEANEVMPS